MDMEERMAQAETDIAVLKETQRLLLQTMEHGFAEQRRALDEHRKELGELRDHMDRNFAEQRAALAEERLARERAFRWSFTVILAILGMVLGLFARMAGVF